MPNFPRWPPRRSRLLGAKRPGPLWSKRQTYVLDRDLTVLAAISSETDMEKHADEALQVLRDAQG